MLYLKGPSIIQDIEASETQKIGTSKAGRLQLPTEEKLKTTFFFWSVKPQFYNSAASVFKPSKIRIEIAEQVSKDCLSVAHLECVENPMYLAESTAFFL